MINPYVGTDNSPSEEEMAGRPATFHHIRVVSTIAGDLSQGDEIVILESGGEVDGVRYEVMDRPELAEADLLFLQVTPKGRYATVGGGQGRFIADGKGGYHSLVSTELQVSANGLDRLKDLVSS